MSDHGPIDALDEDDRDTLDHNISFMAERLNHASYYNCLLSITIQSQLIGLLVERRELREISQETVAQRMGLDAEARKAPAPWWALSKRLLQGRQRPSGLELVRAFEAGRVDPSFSWMMRYMVAVEDPEYTLLAEAVMQARAELEQLKQYR